MTSQAFPGHEPRVPLHPLPPSEIHERCERQVMEHPPWQENTAAHFCTTGATIGLFAAAFLVLVPLIGWILAPLIAFPSLLYLMSQSGMMHNSRTEHLKDAAVAALEEKSAHICEGECPLCGQFVTLIPQSDAQMLRCPECHGTLAYDHGRFFTAHS